MGIARVLTDVPVQPSTPDSKRSVRDKVGRGVVNGRNPHRIAAHQTQLAAHVVALAHTDDCPGFIQDQAVIVHDDRPSPTAANP